MATKLMDEIKQGYISTMGDVLGISFHELHCRLVELHVIWQQYRQLFGNDTETVELLNRTAGFFFKIVQDELWDSVLLGISRMTDPVSNRKNKNLTIWSLPSLTSDVKLTEEVRSLCETAVAEAAFAREHRNKRIAHQDHNYFSNRDSAALCGISRAQVERMLFALREVLNKLELYYCDSTVMYEQFVDETGAFMLVHRLRKLEALEL